MYIHICIYIQVHGKLHLVDLAGSERQNKALTVGSGAVESKHINRSTNSQTSACSGIIRIIEQIYLDTDFGIFFSWFGIFFLLFAALSQRCMTWSRPWQTKRNTCHTATRNSRRYACVKKDLIQRQKRPANTDMPGTCVDAPGLAGGQQQGAHVCDGLVFS